MNTKNEITDSIFEVEDIQYVLFDADDTLFDTSHYYQDMMLKMGERASELINPELYAPDEATRIYEAGLEIHKELQRPILLDLLVGKALQRVYGEGYTNQIHVETFLKHLVSDFYKQSPEILPGVLEVLDMLDRRGIRIGVHSHAQNEWTEIKVQYLKDAFFHAYGREIEIQFFSTSLDSIKNEKGWEEAIEEFDFEMERTLVVGDNLRDDILAASKIGVPNLVFVSNGRDIDVPKDKGILEVENIQKVLDL